MWFLRLSLCARCVQNRTILNIWFGDTIFHFYIESDSFGFPSNFLFFRKKLYLQLK